MNALWEKLSAYLDGELPQQERQEVEALLAHDASARAQLETLRALSVDCQALAQTQPKWDQEPSLKASVLKQIAGLTQFADSSAAATPLSPEILPISAAAERTFETSMKLPPSTNGGPSAHGGPANVVDSAAAEFLPHVQEGPQVVIRYVAQRPAWYADPRAWGWPLCGVAASWLALSLTYPDRFSSRPADNSRLARTANAETDRPASPSDARLEVRINDASDATGPDTTLLATESVPSSPSAPVTVAVEGEPYTDSAPDSATGHMLNMQTEFNQREAKHQSSLVDKFDTKAGLDQVAQREAAGARGRSSPPQENNQLFAETNNGPTASPSAIAPDQGLPQQQNNGLLLVVNSTTYDLPLAERQLMLALQQAGVQVLSRQSNTNTGETSAAFKEDYAQAPGNRLAVDEQRGTDRRSASAAEEPLSQASDAPLTPAGATGLAAAPELPVAEQELSKFSVADLPTTQLAEPAPEQNTNYVVVASADQLQTALEVLRNSEQVFNDTYFSLAEVPANQDFTAQNLGAEYALRWGAPQAAQQMVDSFEEKSLTQPLAGNPNGDLNDSDERQDGESLADKPLAAKDATLMDQQETLKAVPLQTDHEEAITAAKPGSSDNSRILLQKQKPMPELAEAAPALPARGPSTLAESDVAEGVAESNAASDELTTEQEGLNAWMAERGGYGAPARQREPGSQDRKGGYGGGYGDGYGGGYGGNDANRDRSLTADLSRNKGQSVELRNGGYPGSANGPLPGDQNLDGADLPAAVASVEEHVGSEEVDQLYAYLKNGKLASQNGANLGGAELAQAGNTAYRVLQRKLESNAPAKEQLDRAYNSEVKSQLQSHQELAQYYAEGQAPANLAIGEQRNRYYHLSDKGSQDRHRFQIDAPNSAIPVEASKGEVATGNGNRPGLAFEPSGPPGSGQSSRLWTDQQDFVAQRNSTGRGKVSNTRGLQELENRGRAAWHVQLPEGALPDDNKIVLARTAEVLSEFTAEDFGAQAVTKRSDTAAFHEILSPTAGKEPSMAAGEPQATSAHQNGRPFVVPSGLDGKRLTVAVFQINAQPLPVPPDNQK